jgi:tetratricopeptide (TPR) repeat protein
MTALASDLWGNAHDQALLWAELNPQSPRAQAYAAAAERARGRPDLAAARMRRVRVAQTEEIQIAFNQAGAECKLGRVTPQTLERVRNSLRASRTAGRLYFDWMSEAIDNVGKGASCKGLGPDELRTIIDAMDENPMTRVRSGWQQDDYSLRGALALALHRPDEALDDFDKALDADPRPAAALMQAAQLGSAGYPAQGLAHLDHFAALPRRPLKWGLSMASVHAHLLQGQDYLHNEIAHLRSVLQQDLHDSATKSADPRP